MWTTRVHASRLEEQWKWSMKGRKKGGKVKQRQGRWYVGKEKMVNLNALKYTIQQRRDIGMQKDIMDRWQSRSLGNGWLQQTRQWGRRVRGAGMLERTDPPHLGMKHGFHCLMTERQNRHPYGNHYHWLIRCDPVQGYTAFWVTLSKLWPSQQPLP